MKKIISVALALVMMLSVFSVMSLAEEATAVVYEVVSEEEKTCKIVGAELGITELNIPAEVDGYKVVAIANYAFDKNPELISISIPDTVTSIGQFVFSKTAYYKDSANWEDGILYIGKFLIIAKSTIEGEVTVKDGTTIIADAAFRNCKKITKVTIPEGVTALGLISFRDCAALADVSLPSSLKKIGAYAFLNCTALKTVALPEGLEVIDRFSFNNSGITEITIPASVKTIGDYVFCNSDELAKIDVAEENENYSSVDGILYDKEQTTLVYCPYGIDFNNDMLPETVTVIGNGALEGSEFEEYTVPDGITAIGDGAFANCANLKKITIPESVTEIADDAFAKCPEVAIDAVPGSYAYGYAEENDLLPKLSFGDVNGDGTVSAIDARWILQVAASLRTLTEEESARADVNGDNKVNAVDARWILQIAAGTREL